MYSAAVTKKGNAAAQKILGEYFETADGIWRGLGEIKKSTLRLKDKYSRFDALKRFGITERPCKEAKGCMCGKVLCGLMDPQECKLFAGQCTPTSPVGPCMVSSEGVCAAHFKYGGK